jgi:lysozyme family protein
MADYRKHIPFILEWEQEWADDPDDKGGATMKGITIKTYTTYRKRKGLPTPTKDDLRNITDAEWMEIYKTMYWDRINGNAFQSQSVANIMVDWFWMSGIIAIKRLQLIVGTKQDGIVGPKTLAAVHLKNQRELFDQLKSARYSHFEEIVKNDPTQKKFHDGWKRRLKNIKWID